MQVRAGLGVLQRAIDRAVSLPDHRAAPLDRHGGAYTENLKARDKQLDQETSVSPALTAASLVFELPDRL